MATDKERFFIEASCLPKGEALFKDFSTKKEAESFRTALYKIRNKLEDFTVLIQIAGTRVIAQKDSERAIFGRLGVNGEVIGEVVVENYDTRIEKEISLEIEEILKDAEANNWSEELTAELIAAAKDSIKTGGLRK